MSRNKWFLLVIVALVLLFGAYWYEDEIRPGMSQQSAAATSSQSVSAAIANPASTNCVDTLGGSLDIVNTAQGSAGYCHLKDGRVCEEWALFRDGTCNPQE